MKTSLKLVHILFAIAIFDAPLFACTENPGQLSIQVTGATSVADKIYIVEQPSEGKVTVTIKGSGDTPCPTDAEKCKCDKQSKNPETDGTPKYTFTKPAGNQDPADGDTIKWEIDSSTPPSEYKFKLTKVEQKYKACAQGWTGGVTSKSNTQASEEITIFVVKFELDDIVITGGGSQNVASLTSGEWRLTPPDVSVVGSAKFQPTSVEPHLVGKVQIRLIQDVNTVHKAFLRTTPPNGAKIDSGGSYVYDNMAVSTTGTNVALGGIGGTFYDDAPWIDLDPTVYKQGEIADVFKVHLQYSFNSGPWKTIGVRYWSASGSASGPASGNWTGSAWAGPSGSAIPSTDEPVWSPTVTSLSPQTF